jgi:hypothetical protein
MIFVCDTNHFSQDLLGCRKRLCIIYLVGNELNVKDVIKLHYLAVETCSVAKYSSHFMLFPRCICFLTKGDIRQNNHNL